MFARTKHSGKNRKGVVSMLGNQVQPAGRSHIAGKRQAKPHDEFERRTENGGKEKGGARGPKGILFSSLIGRSLLQHC